MSAASLHSKVAAPLTFLAPLPGSGPIPGSGFEEIVSQQRSLKRKHKELDAKLSTLDAVVAQLSNDNRFVHNKIESFDNRMELLEKVFMFVNFDELQKVVSKLAKEHAEPEQEATSPPRAAGAHSHKGVDAEIATADLVEHFSTGNILTSSTESLHAAAAAAVKSSSTESLHAAAAAAVKSSSSESLHAAAAAVKRAKSAKKDSKSGPVMSEQEGRGGVMVAAATAELCNKDQMAASGSAISRREGGVDEQRDELSRPSSKSSRERGELRSTSHKTAPDEEDATESKLSRPRSKAQALRGVMAAKTPPLPSEAPLAEPANTFGVHTFTAGADSASAIRFKPRSKVRTFNTIEREANLLWEPSG